MTHVELSLTESFEGRARDPRRSGPTGHADKSNSLQLWTATVVDAQEPCLVLAADGAITAVSMAARDLLGLTTPTTGPDRFTLRAVVPLVDFTTHATALNDTDASKIPPLLALSSGRLARGLMRVRARGGVLTVDAIATPLWDYDILVGSLTFFAAV